MTCGRWGERRLIHSVPRQVVCPLASREGVLPPIYSYVRCWLTQRSPIAPLSAHCPFSFDPDPFHVRYALYCHLLNIRDSTETMSLRKMSIAILSEKRQNTRGVHLSEPPPPSRLKLEVEMEHQRTPSHSSFWKFCPGLWRLQLKLQVPSPLIAPVPERVRELIPPQKGGADSPESTHTSLQPYKLRNLAVAASGERG